MSYETILLEKKDHIALITMNRPPANTVNLTVTQELSKVIDDVESDKDIRVIVITGAGEKGFSAGFDVSDAGQADKTVPNGSRLWTRISRLKKPVIAAINGYAFGGGCELALACTFRIMEEKEKAKIGLTELNLGIMPGWGGTQRMPRLIGKSKALDLILFSKRLSAREALDIGLVDYISKEGELMKDVMEFSQKLAKRPPISVGYVLEAMTVGIEENIDKGLEMELDYTLKAGKTADAVEGFTAFMQKREPEFKGE